MGTALGLCVIHRTSPDLINLRGSERERKTDTKTERPQSDRKDSA